MKKKLNLICLCVVVAFLLSISGGIQLGVKMFINGFEIGMKAAKEGSIANIPNYQTIHIQPSDMSKITGTVTNIKDGSELAIKPLWTMIDCPTTTPGWFLLFGGLMGLLLIAAFVCIVRHFIKLIRNINRNLIFEWVNVKHLRWLGWSMMVLFVGGFAEACIGNYLVSQTVELAGCEFGVLHLFADPTFILGFIALLGAEIFAVGLRLKEENELTI